MLTSISIALILNGLTLTIALGLLIIILWHDSRRLTNLYFSWFLLMVMVWSAGSLIGRAGAIAGADIQYVEAGLRMLELGFTSSALALYLYIIVLVGNRSRGFQVLAVVSILSLLLYHLALYLLDAGLNYTISERDILLYAFTPSSTFIFTFINLAALVVVWRSFRKIQRAALSFGVMLFTMGQLVALMSPRLRILGVAEDAGALGTLVMAFALIQSQVIQTLAGQNRQIEVVRDVGLVITSRLRLQNALQTIAAQAASLLGADASLIFLNQEEEASLILAAQYNIHDNLLGERLRQSDGMAGKVALERRPLVVNDYRREWRGVPDTALAARTFGAVVAVPLMFAEDVVGVLLVIAGPENRLFEREDVRLLELLAPQAAVAITNSRLYEQKLDLTDELAVAKTRLEAVLSSTDNPVIALNKRLEVIFANQAAARLTTPTDANPMLETDLRGRAIGELVDFAFMPRDLRQLVKDLRTDQSHIFEIEVGERTYMCHLTRMQQPESGWVAVLNDITSLKELERLQRQMIELTSHQLKNPLTGAMMQLELLQDDGEDVFTDEMRRTTDVISQQLERMLRLIEGILNLERLQSRAAKIEQIDFVQLVNTVVDDLFLYAQSKQIALELHTPPELPAVTGDNDRLTQAINCLVDNAIKYTPNEGRVCVEVNSENGTINVQVMDNGLGIPHDAQPHVFERFFRAEQPGTEKIGGTGMGLSLVKAIIEGHKGKVWLESEPMQGTTFFVTLPATHTAANTVKENSYENLYAHRG